MRIHDLRSEDWPERRRVSADVHWERAELPDRTLHLETPREFADDLEPAPEAFLLSCLPAAIWFGEPRVRVEGSVCATLSSGLERAMEVYARWYPHCRPLPIEADVAAPRSAVPNRRSALFLSGGVDSMAMLRANRLEFSLDHPAAMRDGVLIQGLGHRAHDLTRPRADRLRSFERRLDRLRRLADAAQLTLIPMYSNLVTLYPNYRVWQDIGFGAGTISASLALQGRLREISLASTGRGRVVPPLGSHPDLDPLYSTDALRVHHRQPQMTRLEKTAIVAEWPDAWPLLDVCLDLDGRTDTDVNCGRCEKCLRTMLALVALGKLETFEAFAADDVTVELLRAISFPDDLIGAYYEECLAPLQRIGRGDLARALEQKLAAHGRRRRRHEGPRWKRRLRRLIAPLH